MPTSLREQCGITGINYYDETKASDTALTIYYSLYSLQHRGQESAGIAVAGGDGISIHRGMGLVSEVFPDIELNQLQGSCGIGHVRYSTTGGSNPVNSQPFMVSYSGGELAIAHNGNLVNYAQLKSHLEEQGYIFQTDLDTEVIAQLLSKELVENQFERAMRNTMLQLVGSYSLVILLNGDVIGVRDPLGIKPLCIGEIPGGFMLASESCAVDTLGGKLVRDVHPGEVVTLGRRIKSNRLFRSQHHAHCIFEYIYFARPDSIIDDQLVYKVRHRIGERLAREATVDAEIISPIPDSGTTVAIGFSKQVSSAVYSEGLIKNRYVGRTFILPDQNQRDIATRLKLNTVRWNINNRSVVLIDDSIVRGTTSKRIIELVRNSGAREVHMRIGSPPIISPCYLGIDMPTHSELIADGKSVDEVCEAICADSLHYITLEGLLEAVGKDEKDMCVGCLTGYYPIEVPGERALRRQATLENYEDDSEV